MRIGIAVSECWGPASPIEEVVERAQRAEALGYPTGWVPYLPWSLDALASVQVAGAATEHLVLGTAVVPTFFFHPLAMARQALTAQAAVGRPLHLGVGCSNPALVASHGIPFERPARHVEEYLAVLDAAVATATQPAGERERAGAVVHAGEVFELGTVFGTPGASRFGSVLVGAMGPRMLEVAGRCSDGVIATWSDEHVIGETIAPVVRDAAAAAGRRAPVISEIIATAVVAPSRVAAARDTAQEMFGFYQQTMPYKRVVDASPHDRIGDIAVIGDEDEVARRLAGFRDAGMTDLTVAPLTVEGADWRSTAEAIAAITL